MQYRICGNTIQTLEALKMVETGDGLYIETGFRRLKFQKVDLSQGVTREKTLGLYCTLWWTAPDIPKKTIAISEIVWVKNENKPGMLAPEVKVLNVQQLANSYSILKLESHSAFNGITKIFTVSAQNIETKAIKWTTFQHAPELIVGKKTMDVTIEDKYLNTLAYSLHIYQRLIPTDMKPEKKGNRPKKDVWTDENINRIKKQIKSEPLPTLNTQIIVPSCMTSHINHVKSTKMTLLSTNSTK
eukprot:gene14530-17159_t